MEYHPQTFLLNMLDWLTLPRLKGGDVRKVAALAQNGLIILACHWPVLASAGECRALIGFL